MNSLLILLQDNGRRVSTAFFFFVVVLISLMGPMDLSTAQDKSNVGLDKLVLLKLIVSLLTAACAVWGVIQFADVRKSLTTVPVLLLAIVFGFSIAGSTSGVTSTSFPTTIINAFTVVFAIAAIKTIGLRVTTFGIVVGTAVTAFSGLCLYYFFPEKGVYSEPLAAGQFVNRLGGMAHPNSVARSALLGSLLTMYLYRTTEFSWKTCAGLLLVFGWTSYLAMSRTVFAAGFLGFLMLFADQLTPRRSLVAFAGLTVAGLIGALLFVAAGSEKRLLATVVGFVTKSGDVSEITSGTGRTEIWAEASRQIAARPLIGYGFNTGPTLLVNHSQATHNALMNVMMSTGIFGGIAMFGLLLWTAWNAVNSSNLLIRAICTFLFLSCLTEDTVLETFPGPATFLWYVCCVIPVMSIGAICPRRIDRQMESGPPKSDLAGQSFPAPTNSSRDVIDLSSSKCSSD